MAGVMAGPVGSPGEIVNQADVDTMIVALAATQLEMAPFLACAHEAGDDWPTLVTGVGPMETAVRLGRFLADNHERVNGCLQFGVGGAYLVPAAARQPGLLEVCLAQREVLGDFGVCLGDEIGLFPPEMGGGELFSLDSPMVERVAAILHRQHVDIHRGNFVTVNSVSATAARGRGLARQWQGLCENMEGAAVARLCREYDLELAELRVVSNLVEDRDTTQWRLAEAAEKAGHLAAQVMRELTCTIR